MEGLGNPKALHVVQKAFVVPAEEDRIVKLTDGAREYLVDAQRVTWIEIGPPMTQAVSPG